MTDHAPLILISGQINEMNSADTLLANISGNAGTATILQTTHTINGTGFNGSADITITAAPSGSAGGDLSGTYPNPTVAKINGVSLGSTVATSANLLIGSGTAWVTQAVSGDITIGSTGITAIGNNKVTDAMIRQSAGLSIIGNSTNSTANIADITAASDFQILRRSGTAVGFGAIDLSQTNAVGSSILVGTNGGTGINNGSKTITLGGNLTTSGAFNSTFTMTGTTAVTFPTSGTLATTAGTVSSITGTANQVLANATSGSAQTGAVTLTLPQRIDTSAAPFFGALTIKSSFAGLTCTNDNIISGQVLFPINFTGLDSVTGLKQYSRINVTLQDNTAGAEYSSTAFLNNVAGSLATFLTLDGQSNNITCSKTVNITGLSTLQAVATDSAKNLISLAYTNANTVSTLVLRDASGNFSAGTITSALSGNATTSTTATNIAGGALGSVPYQSAAATTILLAGNITTAKQYLSQTGNGSISAAPAWATISGSDITGAALTKTDDTNVTLTLGGTPTTALLRAASLTLGWTGQLANSRGGTGQDSSAWAQGDIPYISATGTWNHLAKNTTATHYLSNTGTTNNPAWAQIDLTNGVTGDLPFANLAQGAALSVLGVTGNAIADVASIVAASDNQVFRRSGTAVAFGAINLASANAVSGILANANTTATNANTASTIVTRDASGDFSAGTITATAITVSNSSTANIDITTSAASAVSSGIKITGARNTGGGDVTYIELWNRDADYATGGFANPSKLAEIIGVNASSTIPQGRALIRLNDGAGTQKVSLTLNYGDGSAGTQLAGIANSGGDRFRFYDSNTGSTLGAIFDINSSNPSQITSAGTLAVMPTSKFGIGIISPISTTHIYESTATTGTTTGLTIEQASTGDSILQYLLTGGTRYQCGIDNSNGDAFTEGFSSTFGTTPNRIVTTAGVQTMPLQPAFYAYANANITNVTGDNTTYTIAYNAESFDQGGNFASNTFTAPVTGRYHFDVSVGLGNLGAAHTVAYGRLVAAGTSAGSYGLFIINSANAKDANNNLQITAGATITLTAGDTVTTTVTVVNSTKTVTLLGGAITNGQQTSFAGYLVV